MDLTRQAEVEQWMMHNRPDAVIIAAAKAGGIEANRSFMADLARENLSISLNLVEAAHRAGPRGPLDSLRNLPHSNSAWR